jgi:hypothetical protein
VPVGMESGKFEFSKKIVICKICEKNDLIWISRKTLVIENRVFKNIRNLAQFLMRKSEL